MNQLTSNAMTALFLQASLQDSIKDYLRSMNNERFPHWDCVVVTASNEMQALGYRQQIEYRREQGKLPVNTEFLVIPDRDGKRVGSAGSTLMVICALKEKYGNFENLRILVVHAGGNSSRTPQYSALGKLFSPVPTMLNGMPATLFDMILVSMASMAGRLRNGMLLLSGDVLLLFNPLMCDFGSAQASVISFKEDVETAKNHGVYLKSDSGNVSRFLHKQTVDKLKKEGAVDERNKCSIDTGAIWIGPKIIDRLFALVDTPEKFNELVNERVRLSLYGDVSYCLAEDSTLECFYKEKPEGEYSKELFDARTKLWNAIGSYRMKLQNLAPARFVHFGSIPEVLKLMREGIQEYECIGWNKKTNCSINRDDVAGYVSVLSDKATVGSGTYLEVSYIHSKAIIGENCYLSFVDIDDENIPDNVLLHGLKQKNGKFVCRIIGIEDNPKQKHLFGKMLECVIETLDISENEIWDEDESHTLWEANLYPVCNSIKEAVKGALNVYDLIHGKGDFLAWHQSERTSLCKSFNEADPDAILKWMRRMEELVRMDEIKRLILDRKPAYEGKSIFSGGKLTKIQQGWLTKELSALDTRHLEDFSYAIRLYYYLGIALNDYRLTEKCFELIARSIQEAAGRHLQYNDKCSIKQDEVIVKLPLRVNWGGGWSDTCPHCNENGGTVINAAISVNGKLPVEVRISKIAEHKIVFDSRDMDVHGEFYAIEELQKVGDPFDPFALQKAAIIGCGIIPQFGGDLGEILRRLGGGFEIQSEVINIPKGSGLGTSSILSAATVKAIAEFMHLEYSEELLYSTVIAMEQIMSTGGGWQDQVGGLARGIKLISSAPSMDQKINVQKIEISDSVKQELSERFALIYTGQRRLARNLLRDVVGRYIGNEPESLLAHREIQRIAALMRCALEKGDVDGFAALLNEHWKLSKMIDAGSTNTLIEQIFFSIQDMIDARMVCGAGGGGFLQVILKKGVSKEMVHKRLKDVFQDFAVDVWESDILY